MEEFWDRMRELRGALAAAGEHAWSDRLRDALEPTARRRAVPREVVRLLRKLRDDEVATRLELTGLLDQLLAMVGTD